MKFISTIVSILFLTSCASDRTSQNLYSSRDIGKSINIKSCTVISSRSITIRDDHSGKQGESIGFIAGNISSRKHGKPLSGLIGGLVGGVIGRNVSDSLHERDGVEYTVLLRNGNERQLVQDIRDGETILSSGSACRLQISGANNRVLSATHYPSAVKRPSKVGFTE